MGGRRREPSSNGVEAVEEIAGAAAADDVEVTHSGRPVPRARRPAGVPRLGPDLAPTQRDEHPDRVTLEAGRVDAATVQRPALDFESFFRAQYPSVVRLSYSLCGSMSVAEELAQEAFISAHRRWRRIEAFDRPDLWVRRVVINRSISHRRREASERRAFQLLRGRRREAVEAVVADEEVWRALRQLSPRQAQVLALFYVEDQPIAAVAEIIGVSEETVRTHLKRGRASMAARLGEEDS
jgi:RNA polymerase sigma-70 factor (ECF subfamily)